MTKQKDYSKVRKNYVFVVFTDMLSDRIMGHVYSKKRKDLDIIEVININNHYRRK